MVQKLYWSAFLPNSGQTFKKSVKSIVNAEQKSKIGKTCFKAKSTFTTENESGCKEAKEQVEPLEQVERDSVSPL